MQQEHPVYRYLRLRRSHRESDGLRPDALDLVAANRARQLEQRRRLSAWLKDSGDEVNRSSYLSKFDARSRQIHKVALELAVHSFALVDGIERANDSLRVGLRMERAGLDVGAVIAMQNKVLRLRLLGVVAEQSGLSKALIGQVLERAAAREFPLRDGTPVAKAEHTGPSPVERALMAEVRRMSGGERDAKAARSSGRAEQTRPPQHGRGTTPGVTVQRGQTITPNPFGDI